MENNSPSRHPLTKNLHKRGPDAVELYVRRSAANLWFQGKTKIHNENEDFGLDLDLKCTQCLIYSQFLNNARTEE